MKSGFIWQPATTSSVGGLRRSSKALLKAKLTPKKSHGQIKKKKKRSRSLFGGLLPVWSITTFWIAAKPLHLRGMFSKLMRSTENCNICTQHWSTGRAQFSTTPDHTLHNQHFKSWTNWATKLCLIYHMHLTSRQLTATSSSISTTFCRENASTTSGRQKMLSKSLLNPEAWIFTLQE